MMKCPHCPESELRMTNRNGVEIDYCPNCRGVWLDRGELDKIIERASRYDDIRDDDDDDDHRGRRDYQHGHPPGPHSRGDTSDYRYHKRKSFWTELFD